MGAILLGTLIGVLVGHRLPDGIQQRVLFAMAIAAFPEDLPRDAMAAIFAGASAKVREAGGTLATSAGGVDEYEEAAAASASAFWASVICFWCAT